MIFFDATDSTVDAKVNAVCAPLFATGRFLQGGHSDATINATVTFVRFDSRVYAVTCHHVLSAFRTQALRTGVRLAPSIHSGRSIHQFRFHGPEGQHRWAFASCRDFAFDIDDAREQAKLERENRDRPDIAIADVTDVWSTISTMRKAEAIDLHDWEEPDWSVAQPAWLAYGYPDGHKSRQEHKVAAPMPRVAVELASSVPSADKPTFTLCSTLQAEHGWGLSGISGGPVLVAHATQERYAYVGITFEGAPSAKDVERNAESFLDARDIVLKGYQLTPAIFRDWLARCTYGVELS